MANITSLLTSIKTAIYGQDMRQSLHDAIKDTNDDLETQKSNLSTNVRATILTGLSIATNAAITATDTVLSGLGKLQAQITARLPLTGGTMTGNISMNDNKITSSAVPSTDNDYANKKYVDDRDILKENIASKGVINGYASLDDSGKVPTTQLPDITITDTFVVSNQTAMLALTAQVGDVAVRTDLSKSFILKTTPASTLSNWQELLTPPDLVMSVAGRTGVVTLTKNDVGLSNVDNTADNTKEVLSSTKLKTARKINGIDFDGTSNITIVDSSKLGLTGGTMTGNISMNANKITSSAVPSTDNDYANKKYVDDSMENLQDVMSSMLMEATSVSQTIEDSIGSSLLDSDGDVILGRVTLVDLMVQAN